LALDPLVWLLLGTFWKKTVLAKSSGSIGISGVAGLVVRIERCPGKNNAALVLGPSGPSPYLSNILGKDECTG